MKAIILAGGFGTRLKSVIQDIPKPMVDISGRPFLEYLLLQLKKAGICDIVLAVGYRSEKIEDRFRDGKAMGLNLTYSHEDSPLGTGGALKRALIMVDEKSAIVMNGDSFFDIDLNSLIDDHSNSGAKITIAVSRQADLSRFGSIVVDNNNNILRFMEKSSAEPGGLINAGIYCINKEIAPSIPEGKISLEYDIFPSWIGKGMKALKCDGFFVDIGLPESLSGIKNQPQQLFSAVGIQL